MAKKTCYRCGTDKGVKRVIDPYAKQVYGEKNPMDLCPKCERERADDV